MSAPMFPLYILEAIILCLLGGIVGIVLGMVLGSITTMLMGYPVSFSMMSIIGAVGFSMIIGAIFGYLPARKAAKMASIEALSYE